MTALSEFRGGWALVTGASSGIGRAFARRLAAAGVNTALSARRADRLEKLAAELRALGVEAKVFPADLARPGAARGLFDAVEAAGVPVRVLINAAGVDDLRPFEAAPWEDHEGMMRLNMEAPAALCRFFHAGLAARSPSALVNVASSAAHQPVPYMAVYAASKAFLLHFSQSLYGEWEKQGILVQALVVGPTDTDIPGLAALKARGIAPPLQSPESVVERSLAALAGGAPVVAAGRRPPHHWFFAKILPVRVLIRAIADQFRPAP